MTYAKLTASILLPFLSLIFVSGDFEASADDNTLVIIANKSIKANSISALELKRIFQKDVERINTVKVIPIHARKNTALRNEFNKKILNVSISEEETLWKKKMVKTGKLPPKELSNTVKAVTLVRDSIGYAFKSDIRGIGMVKILLTL